VCQGGPASDPPHGQQQLLPGRRHQHGQCNRQPESRGGQQLQGHLVRDVHRRVADTHAYPHGRRHAHADEYTNGYTDDDSDRYPDGHPDADSDDDPDEYADRHANSDANEHPDGYPDAHRDGDADQHADAHCDADPDQHPRAREWGRVAPIGTCRRIPA
jgi:hypothetical protein